MLESLSTLWQSPLGKASVPLRSLGSQSGKCSNLLGDLKDVMWTVCKSPHIWPNVCTKLCSESWLLFPSSRCEGTCLYRLPAVAQELSFFRDFCFLKHLPLISQPGQSMRPFPAVLAEKSQRKLWVAHLGDYLRARSGSHDFLLSEGRKLKPTAISRGLQMSRAAFAGKRRSFWGSRESGC